MQKLNKLNIMIAALSLAVFAIIAYLSNYIGVFRDFDLNSVELFHNIAIKHSAKIPNIITDLGYGPYILIFLLILTVILAYYKRYKEAVLITLTTNSAFLLNAFFKEIFKKMRPALEYHLTSVDGYGFPSGHAIIAVCFYGTLIYIIFRLIKANWLKYTLAGLLILLIILISLSRIYLGVHYPTDIAASLFLGVFIIFFWINLYNANN